MISAPGGDLAGGRSSSGSRTWPGYAAVICAAILWAAAASVARWCVDQGASVLELAQVRAWLACAGLGVVAVARRRTLPRPGAGVVLFGASLAAANVSYYLAVTLLPVAVGVVVQYTAPAMVVLWLWVVARRRPGPVLASALVVTLVGVSLVSGVVDVLPSASLPMAGVAAGLASAVAFAISIVTGEREGDRLGSFAATFYGFAVASAIWMVVALVRGGVPTVTRPFFGAVLFLGVCGTMLPFGLFVHGMRSIGAQRGGVVATLEPVAAAVFAWFALGQHLSVEQLAGGALVVIGVCVLRTARR